MGSNGGAGNSKKALRFALATVVCSGAATGVALAASTNFVEPASSPEATGLGPGSLVMADLDGDGDQDVATSNISSGTVTVLKNNGVGNFFEPPSSPETVGSFPQGIAAADVDLDDDIDLAVASQTGNSLTILKNTGTGNFVQPPSSPEPAGNVPVNIAAGDFDGDVDVDLAVANADDSVNPGNVTILRNNGGGQYVIPSTSPEPVGFKPVSLATADFNSDGNLDLAVANQQSGNVTILQNTGSGVNFVQAAGSPYPAGTFPQGVVTGDLDTDGDFEFAVVNQGTNNVTVYKNTGPGRFFQPPWSPEPVGMRPLRAPAIADFDGDIDFDLAVTNADDDTVTILRNNGYGNYAPPPSSPEGTGDSPRDVAAGDLDGDGDADLAIGNAGSHNVTILRNR